MENRKILGATPLSYDGIDFKSKLEKSFYVTLKTAGFDVEYEPQTYIIWKGFRPTVPFYTRDKDTRLLKKEMKKTISIKYTPDFRFAYKGYTIFIEAKGLENDVFYVKKKLFRKYLEDNLPDSYYFEVYTKKQLLQALKIIESNIK